MLTKGLEAQLSAAADAKKAGKDAVTLGSIDPGRYDQVLTDMKRAYTEMWGIIDGNANHIKAEVWSFKWDTNAGPQGKADFTYVPLGDVPTPDGGVQTESNIVQLWSLPIMALERHEDLEQ